MNGAAAGWSGRMLGPDPGEENLWTGLRFLLGHDCWWPSIQVLEARALAEGVRLPFLPGHEAELPNLYVPLLNIVAGARGGVFVDSALYTGRLLAPELRKEHVLKGSRTPRRRRRRERGARGRRTDLEVAQGCWRHRRVPKVRPKFVVGPCQPCDKHCEVCVVMILAEMSLSSNGKSEVRVSTAIMAHPSRQDRAQALRDALKNFVLEHPGNPAPDSPPSALRTASVARATHAPDATHHLVLQDDVSLPTGFHEALLEAVRRQPDTGHLHCAASGRQKPHSSGCARTPRPYWGGLG